MLKDFKRWTNSHKTKITVYDHSNERFFFRPLTIKEQRVINIDNAMRKKKAS